MMKIVVLNDKLQPEWSQDRSQQRSTPIRSNSRVTDSLNISGVNDSEIHLGKGEVYNASSEERNDTDFQELLIVVCKNGERWCGRLCCMMFEVDEPEGVEVVGRTVVYIKDWCDVLDKVSCSETKRLLLTVVQRNLPQANLNRTPQTKVRELASIFAEHKETAHANLHASFSETLKR